MRTAIATLKSVSPYSQSKPHNTPKLDGGKEHPDDFTKRTWREYCHSNSTGHIFIPPMQFKKCLDAAAAFLSIKIKGRGNATYTKHFKAGVLVTDPLCLPIKKDDVDGEWLFLHSQPSKGEKSPRVMKRYPLIPEWEGDVTFHILDDTITQQIFEQVLTEAGNFIGIGRFRPCNGGFYGRFAVETIAWE